MKQLDRDNFYYLVLNYISQQVVVFRVEVESGPNIKYASWLLKTASGLIPRLNGVIALTSSLSSNWDMPYQSFYSGGNDP